MGSQLEAARKKWVEQMWSEPQENGQREIVTSYKEQVATTGLGEKRPPPGTPFPYLLECVAMLFFENEVSLYV